MKFKDYIHTRKIKKHRILYYVPETMQRLFNLKPTLELPPNVSELVTIIPNVVLTKDKLVYLGVGELGPHVVGKTFWTLNIILSGYGNIEYILDEQLTNGSDLWKALVYVNKCLSLVKNWENKCKFEDVKKEYNEQVITPFIHAFVNKLELPVFSDESDTDGLSELDIDSEASDEESDEVEPQDFVVCEYAGVSYGDYDRHYERRPVAVFKTKHDARKFIKKVYIKSWSTRSTNSKTYIKELRTLNPRLITRNDIDYEDDTPFYKIYEL